MAKQTALTTQTVPFETVLFLARTLEQHHYDYSLYDTDDKADATAEIAADIENHLVNRCSVSDLALFRAHCHCLPKY